MIGSTPNPAGVQELLDPIEQKFFTEFLDGLVQDPSTANPSSHSSLLMYQNTLDTNADSITHMQLPTMPVSSLYQPSLINQPNLTAPVSMPQKPAVLAVTAASLRQSRPSKPTLANDLDDDEVGGSRATKKRSRKELLTEEEKKANHIQSEQKRRLVIREGFKRLLDLVPDIGSGTVSKSYILQKTGDYIESMQRENQFLILRLEELRRLGMSLQLGSSGTTHGPMNIMGMPMQGFHSQKLQSPSMLMNPNHPAPMNTSGMPVSYLTMMAQPEFRYPNALTSVAPVSTSNATPPPLVPNEPNGDKEN